MDEGSLNIKQLKFIDNLFSGMSQKNAYIEAGYKDDEGNASRLTSNDKIKGEIERRLNEILYHNRVRLARISETALAKLLVIISKGVPEDRVSLDAVKDALDRAGLKPVDKREYSGEIGYRLLDCDVSKYPKGKNARVPTKNKGAEESD